MNRNVLLVCPVFPPQGQVGALRPAMFSKYLPEYGWKPIVLTRSYPSGDSKNREVFKGISGLPPSQDIIKYELPTGNECIGHSGNLDKVKRFLMPEYGQAWNLIDSMVDVFLESEHSSNVQAVYATSPDFAQITIGMILGEKLNIPVIVDFRDIPEQDFRQGFLNHLYHLRYVLRRYWATRNAFCAIAVSEPQKEILARRLAIPVNVIPNGYDNDMFKPIYNHLSPVFSINYVGRIVAQWLRNPAFFFSALDLLLDDRDVDFDLIEINFIGSEKAILLPVLEQYACKAHVNIKDEISYERVPDLIGKSCINLLLTNTGRTGVMTTKFYEYLGVKRPILCVPDDCGSLSSALRSTNSGVASSDPIYIAEFIKQYYLLWKSKNGLVPMVENKEAEQYSRRLGAKYLSHLLDLSLAKETM